MTRKILGALALAAMAGTASADIAATAQFMGATAVDSAGAFGTRATAGSTYSNIDTFTGSVFNNGGATAASSKLTKMVSDDIFSNGGLSAGNGCTNFKWAVTNLNSVSVAVRMRVRFHAMDGAGGAPGTYITGFSFALAAQAALSVNNWQFSPTVGTVLLPQNFWASITFDNSGGVAGTLATVAQMNQIGQAIYDPPAVGASTDVMYVTTAVSDGLVNNPVGSFSNFGGAPRANFQWEFIPAPSSLALLGLGGLIAGRRRRN